jgi:4-hydroxy-2-oxoheptanedioate aldolase
MTFRARLLAGDRFLTGPFLAVPAPMVVEIACGSAPDFVCIDLEHGTIDAETGENMLRAAAVHGIPALVRVPGVDAGAIGLALDWGAVGVLVPCVSTAGQAAAAVDAARYPPEGSRGAGPGRASRYGRDIGGEVARARAETVVAIQIETVSAVDNLADILAVPGVDLIFVGPGDLGLGLAAINRSGDLPQIIDSILTICQDRHRAAGIFALSRDGLTPYAGRIVLGIVGSDATALVVGFDRDFA